MHVLDLFVLLVKCVKQVSQQLEVSLQLQGFDWALQGHNDVAPHLAEALHFIFPFSKGVNMEDSYSAKPAVQLCR